MPDENGQPEDPYTGFNQLRETQPINLTPEGTWRLSRYADVQRLLRDVPAGMRLTNGMIPGQTEEIPGSGLFMLMQDPPSHTRLRKLVRKAFTPRSIDAWRPRAEALTDELLDRVAADGRMDLVSDLALPVPATLICELLGVPSEDQSAFTQWTADATFGLVVMRGQGDDAIRARVESASGNLLGYFNTLIEARRADPGDDLLSVLIAAEEEGDKLDPLELLSQSIGLLIAGFETTIGLIGNGPHDLDSSSVRAREAARTTGPHRERCRGMLALLRADRCDDSRPARRRSVRGLRDSRRQRGRRIVGSGESRSGGFRRSRALRHRALHRQADRSPPLVRRRRALLPRRAPSEARDPDRNRTPGPALRSAGARQLEDGLGPVALPSPPGVSRSHSQRAGVSSGGTRSMERSVIGLRAETRQSARGTVARRLRRAEPSSHRWNGTSEHGSESRARTRASAVSAGNQ